MRLILSRINAWVEAEPALALCALFGIAFVVFRCIPLPVWALFFGEATLEEYRESMKDWRRRP